MRIEWECAFVDGDRDVHIVGDGRENDKFGDPEIAKYLFSCTTWRGSPPKFHLGTIKKELSSLVNISLNPSDHSRLVLSKYIHYNHLYPLSRRYHLHVIITFIVNL